MSRPRTIHPDDCTADRPLDCEFPTTFPTPPILIMPGEHFASTFTPQLFYYDLAYKYHLISACGVLSTPISDYHIVDALHLDILDLAASLPGLLECSESSILSEDAQCMSRQHPRLLGDTWASLLALHRPHTHTHPESRTAALACALRILAAQEVLFQIISERHYVIYGFAFFTIDAVVFLASLFSYVVSELPETVPSILDALSAAEARLSIMEARSVIAANGLAVVRKCRDMYKAWHLSPADADVTNEIVSISMSDFIT
jgi:hypothetical protein